MPAVFYEGGEILALDSATHTGVCQGEPGCEEPVLEVVDFGRELDDPFDVWSRAQLWLIRRLIAAQSHGRPIKLVVIEGLVPQYTPVRSGPDADAATGNKVLQIGIYAMFGAVARNKGIPVMRAPISTWRAFCLGNGRMKGQLAKKLSVEKVKQLGWKLPKPPNHDAAEAAMQWLWACSQVDPRRAHRVEPLLLAARRGAA